jgi:hypothetical protein
MVGAQRRRCFAFMPWTMSIIEGTLTEEAGGNGDLFLEEGRKGGVNSCSGRKKNKEARDHI